MAEEIVHLATVKGLDVTLVVYVVVGFACVLFLYPESIKPVAKVGRVRIWSNYIYFDPRRCGVCAFYNWILPAAIVFFLVYRKYC
jgi:hypothetical protein